MKTNAAKEEIEDAEGTATVTEMMIVMKTEIVTATEAADVQETNPAHFRPASVVKQTVSDSRLIME